MDKMGSMVWLFPILFMIHDFEEIIFIKPFLQRHDGYLQTKRAFNVKPLLNLKSMSTETFALGVAEEFILVSLVTILSAETQRYEVWLGMFMGFTLHLVIHLIQTFMIRRYTPFLTTTILCLPACIYMIGVAWDTLDMNLLAFLTYTLLGFALVVVNLIGVHKGMAVFDRWLIRYRKPAERIET